MGRVVVHRQSTGVECEGVSCHGAPDAAADGGTAGHGGAVIDLAGRLDGGRGAECFCSDACAVCHGNARFGKAVVAGHAGNRAGSNREAGRATGADAAGREHVRRVVVQRQCTGVECEGVARHLTTDAAADGSAAGQRAAVVGFAQSAGDAGGGSQCSRADGSRHILAGGVEHVVTDNRVVGSRNTANGQACYGHLAGVCHVGAVVGRTAVGKRRCRIATDQAGEGVGRCEARRYRRCSVVVLEHAAVANRRCQCGRGDRRRHILAAGVEHVIANSRVVAARNAGDAQTCQRELGGVCNVGTVIGGTGVGDRCCRIATDQTGKGVGRHKSARRIACSVIALAHGVVADRRRQCGRGDAGADAGNARAVEVVVAGHAGGRARCNCETYRTRGADAVGRCHMRRVVTEHQGAGVERKGVARHGASDAATDRSAAGRSAAVVGFAQGAGNAGRCVQYSRRDVGSCGHAAQRVVAGQAAIGAVCLRKVHGDRLAFAGMHIAERRTVCAGQYGFVTDKATDTACSRAGAVAPVVDLALRRRARHRQDFGRDVRAGAGAARGGQVIGGIGARESDIGHIDNDCVGRILAGENARGIDGNGIAFEPVIGASDDGIGRAVIYLAAGAAGAIGDDQTTRCDVGAAACA